MARVLIVGDGPGGLSAALFLAKNDHEAVVFGQDKTAMHYAELHNYLGIPTMLGTAFQQVARAQAVDYGAVLHDAQVESITADGGGFTAHTAAGESAGDYVILAGGKAAQRLADELGVERTDDGVIVDTEYRTTADRVYAIGRLARPNRSQAIISAGAGATAALDILSREAGEDVTDWDSPPD
jgi:thioredoxin reductase (NADPH)